VDAPAVAEVVVEGVGFLGAGYGLLKSLADLSRVLNWRTTVRAKASRIGQA